MQYAENNAESNARLILQPNNVSSDVKFQCLDDCVNSFYATVVKEA